MQLYENHRALITEILDFDEAHPNAMVPGNEFQQALRWTAAKKGELKTQQIAIGKAIDAMKSANLLGPAARGNFCQRIKCEKSKVRSHSRCVRKKNSGAKEISRKDFIH